MKPVIYDHSTYSSILGGKLSAYYGQDETDERTGDWCAVIWKEGLNGKKEVFRATNTELLEVASGNKPLDMLVAALALYLNK